MKAKDLTEEQKKRLGYAANAVWQYIGSDVLKCMEECGEKAVMPRSHVIEVVVDADRLTEELRGSFGGGKKLAEQNADLILFMKEAPYAEITKALKPAFPFRTYGW